MLRSIQPGAVVAGKGETAAAPKALQALIQQVEGKMQAALTTPTSTSAVFKQKLPLTPSQAKKLVANEKLSDQLEKLKFGLPVKVAVPQGGLFVDVAACVSVQSKDGKKVQGTTVVLPPVLLPVENGKAKGFVPVDAKAAEALTKGDAVKAAVCTSAVVIGELPNSTPAQVATLQAKVARQQSTAEQLQNLGTKGQASSKATEKEGAAAEADARVRRAQQDTAKEAQRAMAEMVEQITSFIKEMQDAKVNQMKAFTRV